MFATLGAAKRRSPLSCVNSTVGGKKNWKKLAKGWIIRRLKTRKQWNGTHKCEDGRGIHLAHNSPAIIWMCIMVSSRWSLKCLKVAPGHVILIRVLRSWSLQLYSIYRKPSCLLSWPALLFILHNVSWHVWRFKILSLNVLGCMHAVMLTRFHLNTFSPAPSFSRVVYQTCTHVRYCRSIKHYACMEYQTL